MDDRYIEEAQKKQVEQQNRSIEEAVHLENMMQTPGWKLLEKLMDNIADYKKLKPEKKNIANLTMNSYMFVSGQIDAIEKIYKELERALKQRQEILKSRKPPVPQG